jgi:hypothetical protein
VYLEDMSFPREHQWADTIIYQTLLARNYRGDIPMSAVDKFPILLSEAEEESSAVPPCFSDEGINVCLKYTLGGRKII